MKIVIRLMGWLNCLMLLVFITGCAKARVTELPVANMKFIVPKDQTSTRLFDQVERVILSRGYAKQHGYGQGELYTQEYIKDKFQASFQPNDGVQKQLGVIYIYFYESDHSQFTQAGIAEYYALNTSLKLAGLQSSTEDEADRKNSRWVATPETFNEHHPPPRPQEVIEDMLPGLVALMLYGLVVILPGSLLGIKFINSLNISISAKRILFIVGSSLLFAPLPLPLSMWGPFVLVPLPLCAPLAFALPEWAVASVAGTAILTSIVSVFVWRIRPTYSTSKT
jgi:hypothetical protein